MLTTWISASRQRHGTQRESFSCLWDNVAGGGRALSRDIRACLDRRGESGELDGYRISGAGRYLMAWGFWLMLINPDIRIETIRLPLRAFWIVIIAAMILAAFLLGARVAPEEHRWLLPISRAMTGAVCPGDRPVWGTLNGFYHTEESPFRDQIIPRRCFTTEIEAFRAGFQPLTGSRPPNPN